MSFTTNQDPTPEAPVDIPQVMEEIAAGHFEPGRVADLSDPNRTQLQDFAALWPSLSVASRRELVREMARQAEQNLALDFTRYLLQTVDDPDDEVRAVSIRALWEVDSTSCLDKIASLAHTESNAAVQEAIAFSLGNYSYMVEFDELGPEPAALVQRALFHLIDSGASWMVRRIALESAAYMSQSATVKDRIQSAYNSDFEQEVAGALVAMGRNLDPRWLPIIGQELSNEDPDIRCEAARAAGEFGQPELIEALSKMVDDEDEEIREVAIQSIGAIGGNKAVETLRFLETQVSEELQPVVETSLEEAVFLTSSVGVEFTRD